MAQIVFALTFTASAGCQGNQGGTNITMQHCVHFHTNVSHKGERERSLRCTLSNAILIT